jgi:hypothetical protein
MWILLVDLHAHLHAHLYIGRFRQQQFLEDEEYEEEQRQLEEQEVLRQQRELEWQERRRRRMIRRTTGNGANSGSF